MTKLKKSVCFPFPGRTLEESEKKFSADWDYSIPLLLKPKDGNPPLTQVKISEIQNDQKVILKLLKDGRILSLDDTTSNVLFTQGYTIDSSYLH